jgi:hypothetical protein
VITLVSIESFVKKFSREVDENNAAIFAGAGLSAGAGFVNWSDLLRGIADELNLDVDREHDLVSLAQYHLNDRGANRDGLNRAIIDHFLNENIVTESHKILARLPIATYWTTNYDGLIEQALRDAGKIADVKHAKEDLPRTIRNRDAVVYKMHGDAQSPNDAVIAKDDYQTYMQKRGPFVTALAGELVSKTFLFLGFSFSDPNLDHVLGRIRSELGSCQRTHYCILRKEQRLDSDSPGDFEYRKIKQGHFINDLKYRYNIQTVLIDSYVQVAEILRKIECVHKQKTIFVSGAADDYSPWNNTDALDLCANVSALIIKRGFRIVNGLGLGVGSAIVEGAFREIYRNQRRKLTDQLQIRPFPQSDDAKKMWRRYREDMLDYSGVAIFIFGNKTTEKGLVNSNGMREEFDIALEKGVIPIPLGFTGSMAEELWRDVMDDFENLVPKNLHGIRADLDSLGDKSRSNHDQLNTLGKILDIL